MGLTKRKNETILGHKIENLMIWKEMRGFEKMGIWEFQRGARWEESG